MATPITPILRSCHRLRKLLRDLQSEIDEIVATARCKFLTEAPQRIGFTFSGSSKTGAGDLMSEYERAQSVAFVTRYDNLPEDMKTHLVEHEGPLDDQQPVGSSPCPE